MPSRTTMRIQWKLHKLVWNLSGGRLGGRVVGMPVLELVTIGQRSGQQRHVLLTYVDEPSGPVVFGTNAGLDQDPAWVVNLRHAGALRMRTKGRWREVNPVEVVEEHERSQLWSKAVAVNKGYEDHLRTLTRPVPIIRLIFASGESQP
jgi:deazaflavin-dependent oxidoreductase (nitroreductase family)